MRILRSRIKYMEKASHGDAVVLQALGFAPYVGTDTNRGKPRQVIRDPFFIPVDDPEEEDVEVEVETLGQRFVWNKATS